MTDSNFEQSLRLDRFDYELPPHLIAQTPLEQRDASRLMVIERATGTIHHRHMQDLPAWLAPGDLMVVNNTRVIPARLQARKDVSGGKVELLLLHRDPDGVWTCLAKPARSLRAGGMLFVNGPDGSDPIRVEIKENRGEGEVAVQFYTDGELDLDRIGVLPLPPYIRAPLLAAERYQTTYARIAGSSAAPTAGLHITDELRSRLQQQRIGWEEVTLHIGLDTFRPVTVDSISEHTIHREWCQVLPSTASAIAATQAAQGRVVAVGTTSARSLEMWGSQTGGSRTSGYEGWADIFITPGYRWRVVDAMLTNFHLPKSTLLMMVSSLAGMDLIRTAYQTAINEAYRFYSFGDAMLII